MSRLRRFLVDGAEGGITGGGGHWVEAQIDELARYGDAGRDGHSNGAIYGFPIGLERGQQQPRHGPVLERAQKRGTDWKCWYAIDTNEVRLDAIQQRHSQIALRREVNRHGARRPLGTSACNRTWT